MALKIVFFFNQYDRGFTETYYSPSASSPSDFNGASINQGALLNALVAFRSLGTALYGVRISQIGGARLSYSQLYNSAYLGTAGVLSPGENADVISTTALIKLYAVTQETRHTFVRGLADIDVTRDQTGHDRPSPALAAGLNAYVGTLNRMGLAMRSEIRPPTGGLVWYNIYDVRNQGSTSNFYYTGTLPLGTIYPLKITLKGVPRNDLAGLGSHAICTSATVGPPNFLTVSYRVRASTLDYTPANMFFTPTVAYYPLLGGWTFEAFTEHKTGRSFGVPRGRRPTTLRRQ